MAVCQVCKGNRYIRVPVPKTEAVILEACYICNLPRATRHDPPVRTRPVAAGEWEREWCDEGVSHAG